MSALSFKVSVYYSQRELHEMQNELVGSVEGRNKWKETCFSHPPLCLFDLTPSHGDCSRALYQAQSTNEPQSISLGNWCTFQGHGLLLIQHSLAGHYPHHLLHQFSLSSLRSLTGILNLESSLQFINSSCMFVLKSKPWTQQLLNWPARIQPHWVDNVFIYLLKPSYVDTFPSTYCVFQAKIQQIQVLSKEKLAWCSCPSSSFTLIIKLHIISKINDQSSEVTLSITCFVLCPPILFYVDIFILAMQRPIVQNRLGTHSLKLLPPEFIILWAYVHFGFENIGAKLLMWASHIVSS